MTAAGRGAPDRTVEVSPERLPGWIERFVAAHGEVTVDAGGRDLVLRSADGGSACLLDLWGDASKSGDLDAWVAAASRDRVVAVLLARRGAHAVGVARGHDLLAHHTDSHYVQGRTKAGGWSQQRYARRRANQADKAFQDAADDAVRVVLPFLAPDADTPVEFLVCGGDRGAIDAVLADPRLAALAALRSGHPLFGVPEPRHAVLVDTVERIRRVPVEVTDPPA